MSNRTNLSKEKYKEKYPEKYLSIDGWEKYQTKTTGSMKWIKDYTHKDMDDSDYSSLTALQRYVLDGVRRLRGRLGVNVDNDSTFIARAICLHNTDRAHLVHSLDTLITRKLLIPTNQRDNSLEKKRIEEKRGDKRREKPLPASFASLPVSTPIPGTKFAPKFEPGTTPVPKNNPAPEKYDPRTFYEEITSLVKHGDNMWGNGETFPAKKVQAALDWALNVEPKGFWVEKIRTLNGLKKCITTIVEQMGDYEPAPPEVMLPHSRKDVNCPVCHGDGIDRNRWLTVCACVRWFDKNGREYTEFEADRLSCEKYGMKQRMTEQEWKQKRGIA